MYKFPLIAAFFLSSCSLIPAVGPDYGRPGDPKVESWKLAADASGHFQEGIVESAPWWEQFGDPELTSLIEKARVANPSLAAASERIRQARAATRTVVSGFLPAVDANYGVTRSAFSENTQNGSFLEDPVNEYSLGLDASWEIDLFGGGRRALESARASQESAEALYDKAGITLVSEVARNYIEYRALQRRVEIAKRNIGIQAESQKVVRAKFEAGMSSELDLSQSTAQLESTRAAVPSLEAEREARLYRLAVLCGKVPQDFSVKDFPGTDVLTFDRALTIRQPAELLRARPDVRSAERLLAARTADIGVAISDIFPKILLVGGFGYQATDSGNLIEHQSQFWRAGPSIRMPIFQGGKILANISRRRSEAAEELKIYEETVLAALEDAQNSLNSYSAELSRVQALGRSFDASKKALKISNDLYNEGQIDFLRLLDSQRVVFSAEDALVQSQQNVASSGIRVYKAFAGSLPTQMPAPSKDNS